MGFKHWAVIVLIVLIDPSAALPRDVSGYAAIEKEIKKTADDICIAVPTNQHNSSVELTADAKAKLGGALKKLADLGVDGAVKYRSGTSSGLLQKDLAEAIKNGDNCRLAVFKTLLDKLDVKGADSSQTIGTYNDYRTFITENNKTVTVYRIMADENVGELAPASDPPPKDDSCTVMNEAGDPGNVPPVNDRKFTLYAGTSAWVIRRESRFPFLSVASVGGTPYFSVSLDEDEKAHLGDVNLRSADGKIIVAISDNRFRVNPNNIFYKERPDKSTLVIYDQYNRQILSIRYNSPKFMTLSGIITTTGGTIPEVSLGDKGVQIGGVTLMGGCFVDTADRAVSVQ